MSTRVLITGALHPDAVEGLRAHAGLEVHYSPDLPRADLLREVRTARVLITRSETTVDREVIDAASDLKIVARAAVGVGNIDLEYATRKGILVMNTPGKNTNSAAEMTFALLLAMLRRLPEAQNIVKAGGWDRHRFSGFELRDKTIGIVGLGNVGHRVARFARGFEMKVCAYDPYIAPEIFNRFGATMCTSLEELAGMVDILSLHVPLNSETRGMITDDILQRMPPGSFVINAARGGLVGAGDLLKHLESGHLAGVALDTFEDEPKPDSELVGHPLVWCTPHIGASTLEAQAAIGRTVVEQVGKAVEGGVVDYPVNLPEIGVMDKPVLKSYAVLAEKLGSLAGQMQAFNPVRVEMHYRGDIAGLDNALLRLSWMKGYAGHVVDDYVSFVNVNAHFEKMGIEVIEAKDPDFDYYKSALKVVMFGTGDQRLALGGIVFDERYIRISLIKDFYFEVEPTGAMLMIENLDKPGVIGDVGSFLAAEGINISSFSLSRNKKGGRAMAIVSVDEMLDHDRLGDLLKIPHIEAAHTISL